MVGWHHQLSGHEFEQALGDGEEQESLVCCSPWGHEESDTTERLKNSEVKRIPARGHSLLFSFGASSLLLQVS